MCVVVVFEGTLSGWFKGIPKGKPLFVGSAQILPHTQVSFLAVALVVVVATALAYLALHYCLAKKGGARKGGGGHHILQAFGFAFEGTPFAWFQREA